MTYKELADKILKMSKEQQESEVTAYIEWEDEYIPILSIQPADEDQSVLDENHPILWVN